MSHTPDILVIGGGPAGMCAAAEAARAGGGVILVEDKPKLGGQLVKQTHKFFGSKEQHARVRGMDIARLLTDEVMMQGVQVWSSSMAVGFFQDGVVGVVRGNRAATVGERPERPRSPSAERSRAFEGGEAVALRPRRIVIATGAYENALPFPNSDLPGVYGAGAVQTLMNEFGVLPGRRVLMIGGGNIGLIISYQLMQAGVEVALLVEAAEKLGGYEVHANKLKRLGVPILTEHSVLRVDGKGGVENATITRLKDFKPVSGSEFRVDVDTVCIAIGLSPLTELLWSAGCRMEYVPELGGYVAWHDACMRTSREEIYVAGDASGIEEASSAMVEGRLAGLAAAVSLGFGGKDTADAKRKIGDSQRQLYQLRQGPFGSKTVSGKGRLWGAQYENFVTNALGHGVLDSQPDALPLSLGVGRGGGVSLPEKGKGSPSGVAAKPVDRKARPVAVIECRQRIPCNPCVAACNSGAISMGTSLVDPPVLDSTKCTGCGSCLAKCPGLAIFLEKKNGASAETAGQRPRGGSAKRAEMGEVTIPYEFVPLPREGSRVYAMDRDGNVVGKAKVARVRAIPAFDRTTLVTLEMDAALVGEVRHFASKAPRPLKRLRVRAADGARKTKEPAAAEGVLICRCEEVDRAEIEAAMRDGNHTFDDLKRILRCGMGSCQGKGCQPLVLNMLARETGKPRGRFLPATMRPPTRPTLIRVLARRRRE